MKDYYRTNEQEEEKEDPQPLTDEEFAEYQKKERRKGTIMLSFFGWLTSANRHLQTAIILCCHVT